MPSQPHGSRHEEMTVREVAARLGVHENTVRSWVKTGVLTPARSLPGSGYRRFSRADIERMREEMYTQFAPATTIDDLPTRKTWTREELLSEEAVERAARAEYQMDERVLAISDGGAGLPWDLLGAAEQILYLDKARAALAAALGETDA